MKLECLTVGPFEENCYLYWDEKTGKGVIFDPGAEAEGIIQTVEKANFEPLAILLTHGHGDHIGALKEVKSKWNLPVYIGKGEEDYLSDPNLNGSSFFDFPIIAPKPDFLVEDENPYRFDSIELRVLFTPGHTKAGVCYLDEHGGILFCGDTLFQGSIGRTDLAGGSYDILIESIQKKILTLPDNIICFPGHTKAGVCYLDEHGGTLFCGDTLFQGSIGRTDLAGGSYDRLIESIQKKILTLPDNIICFPGHGPATTVGAERIGNPFLTGKNRFA